MTIPSSRSLLTIPFSVPATGRPSRRSPCSSCSTSSASSSGATMTCSCSMSSTNIASRKAAILLARHRTTRRSDPSAAKRRAQWPSSITRDIGRTTPSRRPSRELAARVIHGGPQVAHRGVLTRGGRAAMRGALPWTPWMTSATARIRALPRSTKVSMGGSIPVSAKVPDMAKSPSRCRAHSN
jgi:hypothetical protein